MWRSSCTGWILRRQPSLSMFSQCISETWKKGGSFKLECLDCKYAKQTHVRTNCINKLDCIGNAILKGCLKWPLDGFNDIAWLYPGHAIIVQVAVPWPDWHIIHISGSNHRRQIGGRYKISKRGQTCVQEALLFWSSIKCMFGFLNACLHGL